MDLLNLGELQVSHPYPFPTAVCFLPTCPSATENWGFFTKIKRHTTSNGESLTALYYSHV